MFIPKNYYIFYSEEINKFKYYNNSEEFNSVQKGTKRRILIIEPVHLSVKNEQFIHCKHKVTFLSSSIGESFNIVYLRVYESTNSLHHHHYHYFNKIPWLWTWKNNTVNLVHSKIPTTLSSHNTFATIRKGAV